MTRGERIWCLSLSLVLAFGTTVPFLLAYERQDETVVFTGSLLAVEDGNSYVAKMRRGAEGDWLFRSPYSAEPQAGVPAFLGYLLLGKLAAGPGSHEQLVALLHMARVLGIVLVVYATYRFASRFLPEERWRQWATLIAVASGGLGWLPLVFGKTSWLGSQPLELYSPESFGFLAVLTFPHLLLARAFLLLGLDAYLEVDREPRAAWLASAWLIALVVVQPLSVTAAVAAIGSHQLLRWLRAGKARGSWRALRSTGSAVIALLAPVLLVGMYALLLQRDAYMRAWAAQNILTSPHPAHYLLSYSLLIPFTLLGAWHVWKGRDEQPLLLVGWAILVPLLAYLPVTFQRRLPEGAWVVLGVLAASGLSSLRWKRNAEWRLAWGVLALGMASSAVLLVGATQAALSGSAPAFLAREQVAGFEWLAENAPSGSVVLSSYETGNPLPAWAPVFVVIGHGPESAGRAVLEPRVNAFFASSGMSPESKALLQEGRVGYVFVGSVERALGFGVTRVSPLLVPVYEQCGIVIYQVLASASMADGRSAPTVPPIQASRHPGSGGQAVAP